MQLDFATLPQEAPGRATLHLWIVGTIPRVPAGRYYVIAVIDPANQVRELHEQNNVLALPLVVMETP